eukprot:6177004-Pleurochrysis_carterae.AAC.1
MPVVRGRVRAWVSEKAGAYARGCACEACVCAGARACSCECVIAVWAVAGLWRAHRRCRWRCVGDQRQCAPPPPRPVGCRAAAAAPST